MKRQLTPNYENSNFEKTSLALIDLQRYAEYMAYEAYKVLLNKAGDPKLGLDDGEVEKLVQGLTKFKGKTYELSQDELNQLGQQFSQARSELTRFFSLLTTDERIKLLSKPLDRLPEDASIEYKYAHQLMKVNAEEDKAVYQMLRDILNSTDHPAPLTDILVEVQNEVIAPPLTLKDMRAAQTTNSYNNTFLFRGEPSDAAQLLECVRNPDYEEAEKLVSANPALMFRYASYKDMYGNYVMTCPLDEAFTELNSHMYYMFYDKVKDNPPLLKKFIEHMNRPREYFDIEPLVSAYVTYYNMLQDKGVSEEELENQWKVMGKEQAKLPRHMLKEFASQESRGYEFPEEYKFETCEECLTWAIDRFSIGTHNPITHPDMLTIEGESNTKCTFDALLPFNSYSELGNKFTLLADGPNSAIASSEPPNNDAIVDGEFFISLHKYHRYALDQLRSQCGLERLFPELLDELDGEELSNANKPKMT
jgi:hypothetical protein